MKRYVVALAISYLLVFSSWAQEFKIVGYLPYYRFEIADQIDYSKITHLNLAFVNPDLDGNLSIFGQEIDPIIALAKQANPQLEVFISIGGGGRTEELMKAYDKLLLPENRSAFSHSLIEYVYQHDLDGIDVDLEWEMVTALYSPFVLELADSLKSHGKKITAALPGTYRYPEIDDEVLVVYDFINLMAYDLTGPWRPNDPGPHSPREFAENSITYWKNQAVPNDKLVLGVPFYGYDFTDQSNVNAFTFSSMIGKDEHYAFSDQVGEMYYNGIPTIQYKTYYALNNVSGIMIWELGQDAFQNDHEYSLLSAIDVVVKSGELPITALDILSDNLFKVYPNPIQEGFYLDINNSFAFGELSISDLNGRTFQLTGTNIHANSMYFETSFLKSGLYILEIKCDRITIRKKVIIKS